MIRRIKMQLKKIECLILDMPLTPLTSSVLDNWECKAVIPRVIYTRAESDLQGRRVVKHWQKFLEINSGWSFEFYDKRRSDEYMQTNWSGSVIYQVYKNAQFGQLAADILRYCLIYENGGVYIDTTKTLAVPLDALIKPQDSVFLSFESSTHMEGWGKKASEKFFLTQSLFGFQKHHPLMRKMIESVEYKYPNYKRIIFDDPKRAILEFSGPIAFSDVLSSLIQDAPELGKSIQILGIDFFNSILFEYPGSNFFKLMKGDYANSSNCAIVL
jgi:mannosyltransferase OCH1-like enzyme